MDPKEPKEAAKDKTGRGSRRAKADIKEQVKKEAAEDFKVEADFKALEDFKAEAAKEDNVDPKVDALIAAEIIMHEIALRGRAKAGCINLKHQPGKAAGARHRHIRTRRI